MFGLPLPWVISLVILGLALILGAKKYKDHCDVRDFEAACRLRDPRDEIARVAFGPTRFGGWPIWTSFVITKKAREFVRGPFLIDKNIFYSCEFSSSGMSSSISFSISWDLLSSCLLLYSSKEKSFSSFLSNFNLSAVSFQGL